MTLAEKRARHRAFLASLRVDEASYLTDAAVAKRKSRKRLEKRKRAAEGASS